ncbi:MAG: PAS domain-containing protein [Candidatus Magasanikbacteria bacterium]|nr:PAS domain-containing protein [Candidatus Magasanikbacteria bacterium]
MKKDKFIEEVKCILDASLDCIKILDLKGDILYINRGGLLEHGFKDRLQTQNWDYLKTIEEVYLKKIKRAMKKALDGVPSTIEIKHITKGVKGASNRTWCNMTFSQVKSSKEKNAYILLVSRNITKEKKIEEKLKHKIEKLEKINKLLVRRECKMAKMKKRLKKLEK